MSFIVIAYNEERGIRDSLLRIEELDDLEEHEVIVVDDGSKDATASVVRDVAAEHPSVRLISQENRGRGWARATGLRNARFELVAMVDADVLLPRNWLTVCNQHISEAIPVVGGVAIPEGDSTWVFNRFHLEPRERPLALTITGNNLLAKRETLDRVGFNVDMRTAEDILLLHDLREANLQSACIADLICLHHEDKSYGATLRWLLESGVSATHQVIRFRPIRAPDLLFVAWILGAIAMGFAFGVLAALAWLVGFVIATAVGHLLRSFVVRWSPPYVARLGVAAVANVPIIGAYYVGRLAGFVLPNRVPRRSHRI